MSVIILTQDKVLDEIKFEKRIQDSAVRIQFNCLMIL